MREFLACFFVNRIREGAMKNVLMLVGLISLLGGGYFLYKYMYPQSASEGYTNLYIALGVFVVSIICWGIYFFQKFKEEGEQDISITKF
jgi:hypothetical protein